jgi:acyl-CoA thioester hydrolase
MAQPSTSIERRRPAFTRSDFVEFSSIQTRWADNDLYGHVNNSVYHFYFDSVINRYLINSAGLDIYTSPVIAVTAENQARFLASFAYPDVIEAGLAVEELTLRSVRYRLGLFAPNGNDARVTGMFVHVFVERASMRPTAVPLAMRIALERLIVPGEPTA